MKNISQIFKSIMSRRSSMAVLTLALSLSATTAWADGDGGFDGDSGKGVSTILYKDGSSTGYTVYKTNSSGEGNGHAFGVVSSLYIGDASAYMYQSQGCEDTWQFYNICNVSLGWQVRDLTDSSIKKSNNYGLDITWGDWSSCYRHPHGSKSNMGINLHSSLNPGNYQVEFWYYMTGNHVSGCDQTKYYKNGEDNFYCGFIIPGFKNVTTSASFNAEPSGNEGKTITFNHYGTALTTGNCSITGADAGKFSVTSINESGVTVRFNAPSTEGTYTATLTITDANSKSSGSISLTGRSGYATTVEIADAPVVANGPKVTLSGYLRYSGCLNDIMDYGFVYKPNAISGDPTLGSDSTVNINSQVTLKAKETFSKSFIQSDRGKRLAPETTYKYRVYAKSTSGGVFYSNVGTFTTLKECQLAVNDTVYYTVDNTQPEDPCELRFQSIADAIADAKKTHKDLNNSDISAWINASGFVQVPLVFEVAYSSTAYGNSDNKTRDTSLKNINGYSASYSAPSVTKPTERLIVRAKTPEKKPTIKGGFDMTQSRYITLKDLIITYDSNDEGSSHAYSAIELGYCNESSMNSVAPGIFSNSDIHILNCEIDATAFNCLHAVGCNGLVFNECVFNLMGTGTEDNDKYWGASVKLASCKNVQFTRNSLKGSHATSLFLQYAQNTLVMNNVFWNDNLFTSNVAFVRPVVINDDNTQHDLENLAVYYNTFYLADHASSAYPVDFMRFGCTEMTGKDDKGVDKYKQKGQTSRYKADKIYFKWNNCYSYDDIISSRTKATTSGGDSFTDGAFQDVSLTSENYAYNNFWSKGDSKPSDTGTASNLGFGTNTQHINVEEQVCKSTATDPDELVYRGSLLNIGAKPASDPTGLEVANKTFADRFDPLRRSESGGDWTYGAFQQANIAEIDTIVWVGGNSGLWDVRSNWETTSGRKINCANFFSTDLHVIIPDVENLKNVPVIPAWSASSRGDYPEEYVAAGLRASFEDVSQFAKTITIEAGGAIKGVENLNSGTLRYTGASNSLTARRNEWVLVGGVIKPFVSDHSGAVRNVVSGDFYITDQKPHVYMQHFTVDGSTFKPGIPFTSLEESVPTNSAFGIMIPDQYGPLKVPASRYYTRYENNKEMVGDGTVPKTFEFEGRFANENAMPQYSATTSWTFVNNSYPANLNVSKLRYDNSGLDVKVYDYEDKNWDTEVPSSEAADKAIYVKPNNGFAIKASSASTITTTQGEYGSGSTIYYKRAFDDTYLRLRVQNTSESAASTLTVRYNGEMIDKAFSHNETTPEVYVKEGDNIYSSYGIDDEAEVIPVSLRNKQSNKTLSVMFSLKAVEGFESVILEDRLKGETYDLTEGETPFFSGIAPGDCQGRFYLILNYADADEPVIVTDVTDNGANTGCIDIYHASGNEVVVSSAENVALEKVYVTDMSGRTSEFKLSNAHYNVIALDGLQGVYIIKAVGDTASRTEKVIVK